MEHRNLEQVRSLADIQPAPAPDMSRRERLDRWAALLEAIRDQRLNTLGEIELMDRDQRPLMRADNSPLTVAFEDPVLRSAGLRSDKLGDALEFFQISEDEAHYIMCSCMHGRTMSAATAASRVRSIGQSYWLLPAVVLGGVFGLPTLLYLFT